MEQYFGKPLFDRSTRVVVPTAFAREVVGAVGDFSHRLQVLRSRPAVAVAGRIRVGVITSMQSDALPQALHALRQRHPLLDVVVPPLNDSDELVSELKAARLDVALLVRPDSGGSRRLVWRELHRQPYVLLAPPRATGKTPLQLLQAYDWVGYDMSLNGGRVAARYVRGLKPDARCVIELRSMDAIVAMVAQGLGVLGASAAPARAGRGLCGARGRPGEPRAAPQTVARVEELRRRQPQCRGGGRGLRRGFRRRAKGHLTYQKIQSARPPKMAHFTR